MIYHVIRVARVQIRDIFTMKYDFSQRRTRRNSVWKSDQKSYVDTKPSFKANGVRGKGGEKKSNGEKVK